MSKATLVIKDGEVLPESLKKLRLSVDQLEAKLRVKGISSFTDVKSATIEISGQIGYELMRHAKPVTVGELEKALAQLQVRPPQQHKQTDNLFNEVIHHEHQHHIAPELD